MSVTTLDDIIADASVDAESTDEFEDEVQEPEPAEEMDDLVIHFLRHGLLVFDKPRSRGEVLRVSRTSSQYQSTLEDGVSYLELDPAAQVERWGAQQYDKGLWPHGWSRKEAMDQLVNAGVPYDEASEAVEAMAEASLNAV